MGWNATGKSDLQCWESSGVLPQYNGRIFDPNTGFHDYGARMYWPEIGRFISVDPAAPDTANPTTFNRYAYVLNNPYKYVDPNGRVATWVTGLLGLFFGGAYGAITSALSEEGFNWNAVTYWGGAGAVAGLTLGLGVNAYLAATATVSVAELTATAGPAIGTATRGADVVGREIKLVEGFYEAEGSAFKFSEAYYEKLLATGRPAPFLQAQEVLDTATEITEDVMPGFYRYTNEVLEMVYNPETQEVWHIQPLEGD